jgi:hypothetical protein
MSTDLRDLAAPEPLTWWDRLYRMLWGSYPDGVVRRRLAEADLARLRIRCGLDPNTGRSGDDLPA